MSDKTIKGQFTNCFSGEVSNKDIIYCINNDYTGKHKMVSLVNGVTGYEDVTLIDTDTILRLSSFGWTACLGTKNIYDKLFITPNELIKMFAAEGIITVNLD